MIALYSILGIALALLLFGISIYNSLIRLRNQNEEAFSAMDIQMKKRHDLIPNLVETVKGYAQHEASTLENVIAMRNNVLSSSNREELQQNENILTSSLKSIFALSEAYPELKANTNFIALQEELSEIEDAISMSRSYYNGSVKMYNNKIQVVPSNIIANIFGFTKEEFFELDDISERKNVEVKF